MCQQRLLGREEEDLKHRWDLAEERGGQGSLQMCQNGSMCLKCKSSRLLLGYYRDLGLLFC